MVGFYAFIAILLLISPIRIGLSRLCRWNGVIDRYAYTFIGVIGFSIKHNLDRLVASLVFHRPWSFFNYYIPLGRALQINTLPLEDAAFLATMVAIALPFIWVGVASTMQRLRDTGLPTRLVIVFFVPFVNLVFFLLLAIWPSRPEKPEMPMFGQKRLKRMLDRLIPTYAFWSAVMALLLTGLFGISLMLLSISTFRNYGWGLFVGVPFCVGLLSVLLYGYHHPRSYRGCLLVSSLAATILGVGLLAFAAEGLICLMMAAPIGLILSIIGGTVGYLIQRRPMDKSTTASSFLALLLLLPGLLGAESLSPLDVPRFAVRTAINIQAPSKEVWRHVVEFSELPSPTEWWFRLGIAYPTQAVIYGQGVGAVRHCIFSTGAFVEPIEVWEEPRLLKFSVTHTPAPMVEWTPYKNVHPPHLDGFFVSDGGQFLLTPLGGGGTRVEATTWYRHHMEPAGYWQWWADLVLHRIHLRVLKHIKWLAELPVIDHP